MENLEQVMSHNNQSDMIIGKTSLAVQTLVQFLRGDELVKTKKSKKAVYINVNVNEANTVLKQLTDYGKLKRSNSQFL